MAQFVLNCFAMNRRKITLTIFAAALALVISTAASRAADAPSITYRKVFKSSYPEFVEIKLDETGAGTCDIRQLDEEANPQPFEIGAPLAQRIFALAAKLRNFQGVQLDVHRRIASLGEKTFRYQKGTRSPSITRSMIRPRNSPASSRAWPGRRPTSPISSAPCATIAWA